MRDRCGTGAAQVRDRCGTGAGAGGGGGGGGESGMPRAARSGSAPRLFRGGGREVRYRSAKQHSLATTPSTVTIL